MARGLEKGQPHGLSLGDTWEPRALSSTLGREAFEGSAPRAEVQPPKHVLEGRLQPTQGHHLRGVE